MILTTTRELAKVSGVKMLVYGKAGMGKTVLCSTAPNPLIISAESGLLSLAAYDLPVIEIASIDDLTNCYNWIANSADANIYDTICLDSISEISEVVLSKEKADNKDGRAAYGETIDKMNLIIRSFRDLTGKHVYFSAKEEYSTDDTTGKSMFCPTMTGKKLTQGLPYFFDEVFHMDMANNAEGQPFRYLRTQPDFNHVAKDRSNMLDEIEAPDLSNIINKILSGTKPA
jgi:hypothetical protein